MEKRTALADYAARLAAFVPDFRDALVMIGLSLLAAGVWMISQPVALIVVGVLLLAFGLFGVPKWDS